ncbi:Eukaryotic translation initiation factor 4B [Coemansia erecta]|nr:Eukaryotic translation initiation factor 4B [Coemansia erecta]
MSLGDFLSDGPASSMSWADDEIALPSAPMSTEIPQRTTLANALDRKDMIASRRAEMQGPVEFPTEGPFTAYVGNLPYDVTEEMIGQAFGAVVEVRLIRDRDTDRLKGFGYVEFADVDGLKRAVALDGSEVCGRIVRVSVSERRDDRPSASNWRREDGMGSRGNSGFGRPNDMREPREPTVAESTSDWRMHKEPVPREPTVAESTSDWRMHKEPVASERMGGSRSSSGFERSGSGFGRPREPREPREMREPREPREPTVSESTSDWRMHKEPVAPSSVSPVPAERRGGRVSRTSSGDAGEERVWRSPRAERAERAESREPRAPREPREPREPTQSDQASTWRTARAAEDGGEWNKVDRAEKPMQRDRASDERRSGRFRQNQGQNQGQNRVQGQGAGNDGGNWRR